MREPNFRVKDSNGNWLVHRYGDVWVQCQDENRRDRCDELVAGLAGLLQEARELLSECLRIGTERFPPRQGWPYGADDAISAFLDKTCAPEPPEPPEPLAIRQVRRQVGGSDQQLTDDVVDQARAINALIEAVELLRALPGHGGPGGPTVERDQHDGISGVKVK